ncbi:MAG: chorismate synthase [Streptococcaceae bacterium]|jgi:chorismate synthase|nr:chorismate synthase [Streptococcaceae bacterium]
MRILTAGESHGPELTAIIEGVPADLPLLARDINVELARRQAGYGRGDRMKIEKDQVCFISGVRHGMTTGAPLTMVVKNKDFQNWQTIMSSDLLSKEDSKLRRLHHPRAGHADLVGAQKYRHRDLRNVLERSSARETTMRVAIGAVAKKILATLDIFIASHVVNLGGIKVVVSDHLSVREIWEKSEISELRVVDVSVEKSMKELIDQAKTKGDTLGGIVEVVAEGMPAGVGSYVQWDKKLDAQISQALLSINAFKGIEFGLGFKMANFLGSKVMDEIIWSKKKGYSRKTNHLGGFEGGMTNGMPLIIRGVMKPLPTLYKPLMSVDLDTHKPFQARGERSDVAATPAASVVAESVVAFELARALCKQFTSDNMEQLKEGIAIQREYLREF